MGESFKKIFTHFNFVPHGKIFIKPNISGRPPLIPGENTNPEFLKELVEFLLKNGAEEVIIGHGALLGTYDRQFPFDEIIEKGGFSFLKQMMRVKLVDLDKEEREIIGFGKAKFSINKLLKNADTYINLAKLKTHMETTVSLSLKNQMGLVTMTDRVKMHQADLEKNIAYLAKFIKPNLSIVDGIVAMEGNGPHHGKAKKLDLVFASNDMVELDSIICYLIQVDFKEVPHIAMAKDIGVGHYPFNEYLSSLEEYKTADFKLAGKYERFGKNFYAWPTTACSKCIVAINESGKIFKKNPFKNLKTIKKIFVGNKKVNVVIGKADNLEIPKEEKIICIGQCTKELAKKRGLKWLAKCPPSVKETAEYIKTELENK